MKHNSGVMDTINNYAPPSPTTATHSKHYQPLSGIAKALSGLAEAGFTELEADDLKKLFKADNMEPALEIMADVRAYFQGMFYSTPRCFNFDGGLSVAYKRFADNIPMAIDQELVCGVARGILGLLWEGLGLNSLDAHRICKEFAQESPNVSNRREELVKKLQRLDEASQQLLHVSSAS